MDRSIRRLRDPIVGSAHGERRRSVRQKLHTPVYASFSGPQTGMVVDLSELLDLHEDGFAVQTSERLEMNRAVTLCLDLPETSSYIHGTGQVVWSDDNWQSSHDVDSRESGWNLQYVDLPTEFLATGRQITFTFHWKTGRWEGQNYQVTVE